MRSFRSRITPALGALVAATIMPAAAAHAAEWEWSLIPYVWATGVELDVTADEQQVIGAEVSFDEILDRLDFAGQIHFEGQSGHWGIFSDVQFYDFDDDEQTFQGGQLPAAVTAQGDLEMWIGELGVLYSPGGEVTGFALLLGTRINAIDQEIDFVVGLPGNPTGRIEFSETLFDGLVGARYVHGFGNGWLIGGRGDVATGDTEFTWNALAEGGYAFGESKRYTFFFGYRHLGIDFDEEEGRGGATVESDMTLSGPFAAFRFGW